MEFKPSPFRVLVLSRRQAETPSLVAVNVQEPHLWISFHDKDKQAPKLFPSDLRKAHIVIPVDDVELGEDVHARAFSEEHARTILNAVIAAQVRFFVVNCEAGISRSAGCAAALSLLTNDHDSGIYSGNNGYFPNRTIKATILKVAREDMKISADLQRLRAMF